MFFSHFFYELRHRPLEVRGGGHGKGDAVRILHHLLYRRQESLDLLMGEAVEQDEPVSLFHRNSFV